jgi:hypothetical protein
MQITDAHRHIFSTVAKYDIKVLGRIFGHEIEVINAEKSRGKLCTLHLIFVW